MDDENVGGVPINVGMYLNESLGWIVKNKELKGGIKVVPTLGDLVNINKDRLIKLDTLGFVIDEQKFYILTNLTEDRITITDWEVVNLSTSSSDAADLNFNYKGKINKVELEGITEDTGELGDFYIIDVGLDSTGYLILNTNINLSIRQVYSGYWIYKKSKSIWSTIPVETGTPTSLINKVTDLEIAVSSIYTKSESDNRYPVLVNNKVLSEQLNLGDFRIDSGSITSGDAIKHVTLNALGFLEISKDEYTSVDVSSGQILFTEKHPNHTIIEELMLLRPTSLTFIASGQSFTSLYGVDNMHLYSKDGILPPLDLTWEDSVGYKLLGLNYIDLQAIYINGSNPFDDYIPRDEVFTSDGSVSLSNNLSTVSDSVNIGYGSEVNSELVTSVGWYAGWNTSGFLPSATFVGAGAGQNSSDSLAASYIGNYAGQGSNGGRNVGVGYESFSFSTGNTNTFIGDASGNNITGDVNVGVGTGAGRASTASNCVYIGTIAGEFNTVDNKFIVSGLYGGLLDGSFLTGNLDVRNNLNAKSLSYNGEDISTKFRHSDTNIAFNDVAGLVNNGSGSKVLSDDGSYDLKSSIFDKAGNNIVELSKDGSLDLKIQNTGSYSTARSLLTVGEPGSGINLISAKDTYTAVPLFSNRGTISTDGNLTRGMLFYSGHGFTFADGAASTPDGNTRLHISNSGNVGIGTTTPQAKLDVDGNFYLQGNISVDNMSVFRTPMSYDKFAGVILNKGIGWYTICEVTGASGRSSLDFIVRATGGNVTPSVLRFRVDRGWGIGSGQIIIDDLGAYSTLFSNIRIMQNTDGINARVDVFFPLSVIRDYAYKISVSDKMQANTASSYVDLKSGELALADDTGWDQIIESNYLVSGKVSTTRADEYIDIEGNKQIASTKIWNNEAGYTHELGSATTQDYFRIHTTAPKIGINQNVGIKTDNPSVALDVNGEAIFGDTSTTEGGVLFSGRYNEIDKPNIFGTMYASSDNVIGYGVKPKEGAVGLVSSANNTAWHRGAMILGDTLEYLSTGSQDVAVGDDISLTTRLKINENGNIDTFGNFGVGTAAYGHVGLIVSSRGQNDIARFGKTTTDRLGIAHVGDNRSISWHDGTIFRNIRLGTYLPNQGVIVDGKNSRLGIGVDTPSVELDVKGSAIFGDRQSNRGVLLFSARYSTENDKLNTFGSMYSTSKIALGYAVKPKENDTGLVSSANNIEWGRAVLLIDKELEYLSLPRANVPVGDDITLTSRFKINENGNVGIGTTTPSAKLEIRSSVSGLSEGLRLTDLGSGSGEGLWIQFATSNMNDMARIGARSESVDSGALRFYTKGTGDSNSIQRVILDETGSVGIGTNSPAHKLDVNGTINSNNEIQTSNSGNVSSIYSTTAESRINLTHKYGTTLGIYIDDTSPDINITSTHQMIFKSNNITDKKIFMDGGLFSADKIREGNSYLENKYVLKSTYDQLASTVSSLESRVRDLERGGSGGPT